MRPAGFNYHRPSDLDQALDLLATLPDARVISGGQSLIPSMVLRLAMMGDLIDIGAIPGLDRIAVSDDRISIGARVTHAAIERSDELRRLLPALPEAARHIAHPAIRTRGTFGGSLAHGDAAAEWATLALALGGIVRLRSKRGARAVAIEDFFTGPLSTDMESDEILLGFDFPRPKPGEHLLFAEFARQAGAFGIAIVAIQVSLAADGVLAGLRVAVGGCGDTAKLPLAAAGEFQGRKLTADTIAAIADAARAALHPQTDLNATADDRRQIVCALIGRTLGDLARRHATGSAA
jgi:CO/xanthine dehydrogenase FAD-binding subunit